jgi:hypothetical protein
LLIVGLFLFFGSFGCCWINVMPRSKKPGWVNWIKQTARGMILEDLEPGGILYGRDDVTAERAFTYYKTLPEFENIVFSQFEARLKGHRKQVSSNDALASRNAHALEHDRGLYLRPTHNERGEPVFDMHPAKELLRGDIRNGVHQTMSPSELQRTRPEYMVFDKTKFKHRIYQEVRRNKFLHHLDLKRKKERPAPPRSGVAFT